MIVHISSPATFHALDLARQMARLGHLGKFYTGLPSWMTPGLPEERVCRQPLLLAPHYVARKLHSYRLQQALSWPTAELFDLWLASKVASCDVFHCLSGVGLRAHRVAKRRYGALTVCDRGSSHIAYQDDLLREEFERWGMPYHGTDPRVIEKEQSEYEECDLITIPSEFVRRSFIERSIPSAKLAKIPYGVDLRDFHPVAKPDKIFRVLYVGQMSLRKGLPYLLQALARLRLPDYEVMLIGSLQPEAQRIMSPYAENIKYVGPRPRSELYHYYSQASVFVIASVEEGLAMVMAQAMACGLPVIATTNTGAEDLFTDGVEGFIVPIRNPEAIREKVLYLYKNPEVREQMSQAALRRVQALDGWNEYGDQVAHAYARALTGSVGP